MLVNIREINKIRIIDIGARIDAATFTELDNALKNEIASRNRKLLVDFKNVRYISSSGLRALVSAAKELKKEGGEMILCSLNTDIYKIFRLSGFTLLLKILPDEMSALTAFNSRA